VSLDQRYTDPLSHAHQDQVDQAENEDPWLSAAIFSEQTNHFSGMAVLWKACDPRNKAIHLLTAFLEG